MNLPTGCTVTYDNVLTSAAEPEGRTRINAVGSSTTGICGLGDTADLGVGDALCTTDMQVAHTVPANVRQTE